ncbi:MAG: cytochrome P460 family protein [Alphaproteobacteria bacterium]|nr:cytochrome P460 family protein [Alphaproteobacteria bacterium]
MRRLLKVLVLLPALAAGSVAAQDFALETHGAVGPEGEIRVPDVNYRGEWVALGNWITNGAEFANEIHTVYTQREAVAAYLENGSFPDGTVVVKELLSAEAQDMTTGFISHATTLNGWFVMVKDTEGRFPDNALWGDGWGWAQFSADAPRQSFTKDYEAECRTCHVPAQDTDWLYTWGYPALR